jgi:hypothetical protein
MADLDHLYELPLEEFTPARDAAARELRKAGDRETAAVVARLPKPTPAAWTANQVAREQPELIEAMLDAGAALREAQEAAVSGGGGRGLREATLAERAAIDAVMSAATAHRPAGRALSRAIADRLRTTLHAAAADESIREALAAGRLVSEAQAGGAWPFALEPAEREPPKKKPAAKRKAKAKPKAAAASSANAEDHANAAAEREAAENAEREAAERESADREAAEARKALEAQLRDARGSLRVRERVVAGAEEDAEQAAQAAAEAQEVLEAARRATDDARLDAEAAERVLAEAKAALNEARDDVARLEERLD